MEGIELRAKIFQLDADQSRADDSHILFKSKNVIPTNLYSNIAHQTDLCLSQIKAKHASRRKTLDKTALE